MCAEDICQLLLLRSTTYLCRNLLEDTTVSTDIIVSALADANSIRRCFLKISSSMHIAGRQDIFYSSILIYPAVHY